MTFSNQCGYFGGKYGVEVMMSSQIGQQCLPDTWKTPHEQYADIIDHGFFCVGDRGYCRLTLGGILSVSETLEWLHG